MTSTPFTTRSLTSPSITASCMTTPIRRVLSRLHSRNSAPSRSSSTYFFMSGRLCPASDTSVGVGRHDPALAGLDDDEALALEGQLERLAGAATDQRARPGRAPH